MNEITRRRKHHQQTDKSFSLTRLVARLFARVCKWLLIDARRLLFHNLRASVIIVPL